MGDIVRDINTDIIVSSTINALDSDLTTALVNIIKSSKSPLLLIVEATLHLRDLVDSNEEVIDLIR